MKKYIGMAFVLASFCALFFICAFWSGLTLRFYHIKTDKLSEDAHLRLALLTDLHSCVYGEGHRELLDLVLKERPDAILLGGDIVDDSGSPEGALTFFQALSGTGIPTYYVSGNHDRWRTDFDSVLEQIKGYGIVVLDDEMLTIDLPIGRMNLCGLREYAMAEECASAIDEAFSALSPDAYNILLAHRPDYIDIYCQCPVDLVLSGHTHGGQVRVPFLVNGLFAPNQGWFPPYAGGLYQVGRTQMVVSRGLSYNPKLPRIFNPPEVVIVDIEGTRKTAQS